MVNRLVLHDQKKSKLVSHDIIISLENVLSQSSINENLQHYALVFLILIPKQHTKWQNKR